VDEIAKEIPADLNIFYVKEVEEVQEIQEEPREIKVEVEKMKEENETEIKIN
jgi:hypothetical protein